MNKPVSIIVKETRESIINVLNKAELHPAITKMILDEIYREFTSQLEQLEKKETAQYEESLKTEEETVEDNE